MRRNLASKTIKITNLQLRQSNSLLRKNLRRVVSCSEDNEKVQERMDEMEAVVFSARSIKELFDSLIIEGRNIFGISVITVALEDTLKSFYPDDYKNEGQSVYLESQNVIFVKPKELAARFINAQEPILRSHVSWGTELFFPGPSARKVRSEALAPLWNNERVLGAICFGSGQSARFLEEYGSRFLKRLARMVTLKMELFRAMGQKQGS